MENTEKFQSETQIHRKNKGTFFAPFLELELLKNLPKEFKVYNKPTPLGLLIQVFFLIQKNNKIDIDKNLFTKYKENVIFNIFLDYKYPFQPPKIFCLSPVFLCIFSFFIDSDTFNFRL